MSLFIYLNLRNLLYLTDESGNLVIIHCSAVSVKRA